MGQVTHWCCALSSNQTRATLQCSQSQNVQRYYLPTWNQDKDVTVSEHRTNELIHSMSSYNTWFHLPSSDCIKWIHITIEFSFKMSVEKKVEMNSLIKWVHIIYEFTYLPMIELSEFIWQVNSSKSSDIWIHVPRKEISEFKQ